MASISFAFTVFSPFLITDLHLNLLISLTNSDAGLA